MSRERVAYLKAYREFNKERIAASKKAWNVANKERKAATNKAHYEANKGRYAASVKAWVKAHPGKRRAISARYRAAELRATPPWQSSEELDAVWEGCPPGRAVDHIHPLKGKYASGLNVPWNLQYLSRSDNSSKNNRAPPPGYLDWWSEQWCTHAPPTGRVWTPHNPEDE
jgi:hypothetical protein